MRGILQWTLTVAAVVLVVPSASAQTTTAVQAALAHVRGQALSLRAAPADVANLGVSSAHQDARSGATYVYVQQRVNGIDVAESVVSVAVGPDGRVLHAAGALTAGTGATSATPGLSAGAALARAADAVGEPTPSTTVTRSLGEADRKTEFGTVAGDPVAARLVYVPTDGTGLRLAWEVMLPSQDTQHLWVVRVDAETGAELERFDLVVHDTFGPAAGAGPLSFAPLAVAPVDVPLMRPAMVGRYTVYPFPVESPNHASPAPPADSRVAVANPDNAAASPFGWHDTNGTAGPEFTTTQGNNVHAYTDTDANNVADLGSSPDGTATLTFNFPADLTQSPATYRPASVVNLFYWNNVLHDLLYQYGFTEVAGNFQTNNYGKGGTGNDDVRAESQDGNGFNNANFSTPADGGRPRMQMYIGNALTPNLDGSFDNGVVVHEYGHGISTRLTGGPANSTCLNNAEQQGEGWSDFYALMLHMKAGDSGPAPRSIGTYLFGQPTTGPGIRPAPYSTNFAVNNYTYGRTRTIPLRSDGNVDVHSIGFVWATILWEATWDLIGAHGYSADLYSAGGSAGNQIMMNLVTTGLKLQPCSPGFVSSRDAILAADAQLYPDPARPGKGLHHSLLYAAFARRGLGLSANQGAASTNADNVEAFNADPAGPAPAISVSPATLAFSLRPNQSGSAAVSISNTAAAGSGALNVSASFANLALRGSASGNVAHVALPAIPVTGQIDVRRAWPETAAPGLVRSEAAPAAPEVSDAGSSGEAARGAAAACVQGQTFDQLAATFAADVVSGGQEIGQSFTAPCTGLLNSIVPVLNFNGSANTLFGLTMRVFAGSGTGGALLASSAYTFTNRASGAALITFQLQTPVRVTEGQTYTWFFDMTSGTTGMQGSDANPYAGGALYVTSNGNPADATRQDIEDVQFQLVFGAQTQFSVAPSFVSVAPGSTASVTLDVNSTGLAEGTYSADLVLTTNAPARPTVTVPVTLTVGGSNVVAGAAGWRMLAPAASGMTVDDLAATNLVQGVPGFYPGVGPNLFTGYTGSAYTTTGTGAVLPPGRGFWWYFYNVNLTPGGPSNSTVLPTALATTKPAVTTDVPVALHAEGDKTNLLGNPFGVSLDVSNVAAWPGAANLSSFVLQVWKADGSTYENSVIRATVSPWQGFWAEGATAGTLTIPASARSTGGALSRPAGAPEALVAFELASADGALRDESAALTLGAGRDAGHDRGDAVKLAPISAAHVLLAFATGTDGALRAVESRPLEAATLQMAAASVGAGAKLVLTWPRVEGLPEGWTAMLRDLETGQTVDLGSEASYAFTVSPSAARGGATVDGATVTGVVAALALSGPQASALPVRFELVVGPRGVTAGEAGPEGSFALDAPRPNPSRGVSTVGYVLPEAGPVRLSVFDLLGREVSVVASGDQASGRHVAAVDVSQLAPGVYVVRLASGRSSLTRRLVVVR